MTSQHLNLIFSMSCILPFLSIASTWADVCPNCAGTGRMIRNFENVKCSQCDGSGQVAQGGIPNKLPQMGYQTNKFELKANVEAGGWNVAWAQDVTETDAVEGVVAAGVSVAAENPGPFIEWLKALVDRTVDTLENDASRVGMDLKSQIRDVASNAIRSAIQGQSAKETVRGLGQIDMKAGAIRYSGRNYIGDQTISRTWGIKPYIALRWRRPEDTGEPSGTPGVSSDASNQAGDQGAQDTLFNNALKVYEVKLYTGTKSGAGTDANVFMSVVGSLGINYAVPLEKPGNDRERGDVDTYRFKCRNLGELSSIDVWHDNSGIGPGWYLEKVEITNVDDNTKWFFQCDNWLAVDEGDRRVGRMLKRTGEIR